jgi:hypothetical protein
MTTSPLTIVAGPLLLQHRLTKVHFPAFRQHMCQSHDRIPRKKTQQRQRGAKWRNGVFCLERYHLNHRENTAIGQNDRYPQMFPHNHRKERFSCNTGSRKYTFPPFDSTCAKVMIVSPGKKRSSGNGEPNGATAYSAWSGITSTTVRIQPLVRMTGIHRCSRITIGKNVSPSR